MIQVQRRKSIQHLPPLPCNTEDLVDFFYYYSMFLVATLLYNDGLFYGVISHHTLSFRVNRVARYPTFKSVQGRTTKNQRTKQLTLVTHHKTTTYLKRPPKFYVYMSHGPVSTFRFRCTGKIVPSESYQSE